MRRVTLPRPDSDTDVTMHISSPHASDERIVAPDRAPAELLTVRDTAALLGCSPRHVHRQVEAGRMPQPVRLGALVRWRRSELHAWIDRGCPPVRDTRGGGR